MVEILEKGVRRTALSATVHCLTGCAIGEVLGMVIGTALLLSNAATLVISIVLAFFFGYALTVQPLLRSGLRLGSAATLPPAPDTLSIPIREMVNTPLMPTTPGAMSAGLDTGLF